MVARGASGSCGAARSGCARRQQLRSAHVVAVERPCVAERMGQQRSSTGTARQRGGDGAGGLRRLGEKGGEKEEARNWVDSRAVVVCKNLKH